jgi:hypothetical protein
VLDDEGGDPAVLSLKERLRGMAVRAILFMPMTIRQRHRNHRGVLQPQAVVPS